MAKGRCAALIGGIAIGAVCVLFMDQEKADKIRKSIKSVIDKSIKPTVEELKDNVENFVKGDN